MDPTIDDYQGAALFGTAPNTSTLTANMLNPSASGPDDWQTILTQGIAGATINGINGLVANAVQSGQLQNVATAQSLGLTTQVAGQANIMPLLLIAAVLFVVVR